MKLDVYGNSIFQDNDIFNLLYKNVVDFENIMAEPTNDITLLAEHALIHINTEINESMSVEEYDADHQDAWFIPEEYKTFDVYSYCLESCSTDEQQIRCMEELVLYEQLNLIPILSVLKYIVDTLRQNNVVWGVGRGSSVASYVLFKLGIHKIDSLKFNLDYKEFLRVGE